jgi:hypothetical protein
MKMKNFATNMIGMVTYLAFDGTARQEKPLLVEEESYFGGVENPEWCAV